MLLLFYGMYHMLYLPTYGTYLLVTREQGGWYYKNVRAYASPLAKNAIEKGQWEGPIVL